MFQVLKACNFGNSFIKWIEILYYMHPKILVKNNGWLSEPIGVERGIRQGCPISAILFIIAIEMMAINIRKNKNIKGMNIGSKERKLSQYADDSTLTLTNLDSIDAVMKTIYDFCDVSGMKLNIEKTEGIWLGSLKDNPSIYHGIQFTSNAVRILGIYLGHDQEKCYHENWTSRINKLKNCIHVWKSRKLTLYGKILILKSLAMSKLIFVMSVLNVPKAVVKEISKCFYSFVWNKVDRIKRNTLICTYEQGGLNMIDVESMVIALKAAWIPRLLASNEEDSILFEYLHNYSLNLCMLLDGNIVSETEFPDNVYLPAFYTDCIAGFNACKTDTRNKDNVHEFLTQPIWCNNQLTIKGRSLYMKNWIDSGFIRVKDLYNVDGSFLDGEEVFGRLKNKSNWIGEYKKVKMVVKRKGDAYRDKHYAQYENVRHHLTIHCKSKTFIVVDQKCNFFYKLLIEKKCIRPYMEKYWTKEFEIEIPTYQWEKIYLRRVHALPDKKVSLCINCYIT